jgi:hypothetical protein
MSNKGKYPTDADGNMLEWVGWSTSEIIWKEMKPFTETLSYKNFSQGRSSVRFIVETDGGVQYSLMKSSFDTFINEAVNGKVTSEFVVVKRGANYGLVFTKDL